MTGNELYLIALDLLSLRGENGENACDTVDLKVRALNLINILLTETACLSTEFDNKRHEIMYIDDLSDILPCEPFVARAILPYGLASLLALGEDDAVSERMARLYNDAKTSLRNFKKAKRHEITEVYR